LGISGENRSPGEVAGVGGPSGEERRTADAPEFSRPKPRSLALNSSAVFVITVVIQLISFIPTFLFSQAIGAQGYGRALLGTIQFFLLIATSVTNLGDLRVGSAYTFFVSRGQSPKESTGTYLLLRFGMVCAAGLVLAVIAPSIGLSTAGTLEIFAVWMTFPLLWSFSTVYQQAWIALGDSLRSQLPLLVESLVRAAALSFVAVRVVTLGRAASDPNAILWAMTEAYLVGAVASTLFTLPTIIAFRGPFRSTEALRMFRWSWPLMGSMLLLYLSGNLVSLVVYPFLGGSAYNVFNAANAFRILALALPVAIAIPFFPHISALHKAGEFEQVRARTWQALRFTAMLVVPGVIALVIYRSNLLSFYKAAYVPLGSTALAILAVSAIPAALSQIIGTTMQSIGRTRLELYVTSAQVGTLAVLSVLLLGTVPAFAGLSAYGITGINGAAWAILGSSVAALLLNTYFMERLIGVRIQLRSVGTICLSSIAAFLAISRINHLLGPNRYYQLLFGVLVGFAVYLVVLALVGELTKQDVREIVGSLGFPDAFGAAFAKLCWKVGSPLVNPMPEGAGAALVPLPEDMIAAAPDVPLEEEKPHR
jgi:O-antigen/teichoic acid export membrane protein